MYAMHWKNWSMKLTLHTMEWRILYILSQNITARLDNSKEFKEVNCKCFTGTIRMDPKACKYIQYVFEKKLTIDSFCNIWIIENPTNWSLPQYISERCNWRTKLQTSLYTQQKFGFWKNFSPVSHIVTWISIFNHYPGTWKCVEKISSGQLLSIFIIALSNATIIKIYIIFLYLSWSSRKIHAFSFTPWM